jgi:hypothetical protein
LVIGDFKHELLIANHSSPAYSFIGGELRMVTGGFNRKSPIANHRPLKSLEGPGNSRVAEGLVGTTWEFHFGLCRIEQNARDQAALEA